ncbi:MAG TPA: hypothetical protein VFH47_09265, partial [Candidatus Thermoplasmatota archaeon]|nr:hypothetical protein [Candidatus Thermoplasmatota archaeon]
MRMRTPSLVLAALVLAVAPAMALGLDEAAPAVPLTDGDAGLALPTAAAPPSPAGDGQAPAHETLVPPLEVPADPLDALPVDPVGGLP